ncbi:hypothetical protein L3X38_017282 [Prunus dulcis]|uniref:Uncharacterized protein n=1 Tax=Prunus dulcis TaxID=3755 RepID=A0AAD4W9F7_PRUDU|nr:hypothetical protein L3X38_017282 [Prunus dulcis]
MVGSKRLRGKTTATAHSGMAEASLPPRARSSNIPWLPLRSNSSPASFSCQRIPTASQRVPAASHGCQRVPTASRKFPAASHGCQLIPTASRRFLAAFHGCQRVPAASRRVPAAPSGCPCCPAISGSYATSPNNYYSNQNSAPCGC